MNPHPAGTVSASRQAERTDAARLSAIAERTFRDTFASACKPEDMTLHCAKKYGEAIQLQELLDPHTTTLVCEHESKLIGYAQMGFNRSPACITEPDAMEIHRLYVDKRWHGKGIAQILMTGALDHAEKSGAEQIWLGVWEHNPRAIAFYQKYGFVAIGEHVFLLGADPQRDLIMLRTASSAPTKGTSLSL